MFGHKGFGYGAHGFGGFHGGEQIIMMILMLIIIVLIAYLIFRLNNKHILGLNNSSAVNSTSKALDILNDRFANGEISEEEYVAKKKLLKE